MANELVSITTDATVNAETICALLRKIAALGLTGPVRLVMDNARYPMLRTWLGRQVDFPRNMIPVPQSLHYKMRSVLKRSGISMPRA